MRLVFGILAALTGLYSVLILIRIIFSWIGNFVSGKPVEIINKITDPYLDRWKRVLNLRVGFFDFSAVAAIVSISFIQRIFTMLSSSQRFSAGSLAAVILTSLWSIIFFITGFCLVIIILRAIAYLTNRNIYSPFWSAIESVSQPIMYNISRIIFGRRIVNLLQRMIISVILLALIMFGGRFAVNLLAGFLYRLQI